jgi:hypothetical protein
LTQERIDQKANDTEFHNKTLRGLKESIESYNSRSEILKKKLAKISAARPSVPYAEKTVGEMNYRDRKTNLAQFKKKLAAYHQNKIG